jgi:mono/diheme cytochrome c family protein
LTNRLLIPAAALAAALSTASAAFAQGDGAALFQQNCSACHQTTGQGVPGAFPALAGDKFVVGDPKGPAYVVTHGRGGMPNFSEDLDDKQVAAILSFVRNSWGNKAPALDAALVASVRGAEAPPNEQAGLPFH